MSTRTTLFSLTLPVLVLAGSLVAVSQGEKKPQGGENGHAMPEMPMPKPTKEHEWLKGRVGTWETTVTCMGQTTRGTEVTKAHGDFWVISDFEGSFMNMPYKGHGLMTFDPDKKKFVSTWCDTMSPTLMVSEGTTDAAGKVLTMEGTCKGMEGVPVTSKQVMEIKDNDSCTFTMYDKAKGPSDPMAMKIEYKRKK